MWGCRGFIYGCHVLQRREVGKNTAVVLLRKSGKAEVSFCRRTRICYMKLWIFLKTVGSVALKEKWNERMGGEQTENRLWDESDLASRSPYGAVMAVMGGPPHPTPFPPLPAPAHQHASGLLLRVTHAQLIRCGRAIVCLPKPLFNVK